MKDHWNILNQPLRMMGETFTPRSFDDAHFEMDWTMLPGDAVPPHMHSQKDEHFTVTQGEVTFMVKGETLVKKVGDTLLVPKGVRHSIRNQSKELIGLRVRYTPNADTHKMFTAMSHFSPGGKVGFGAMLKTMYVQKQLGWIPFSEGADAGGRLMFGVFNGLAALCGALGGWRKYLKDFEE